jgi:hypothetical protein
MKAWRRPPVRRFMVRQAHHEALSAFSVRLVGDADGQRFAAVT